MCGKDEELRVNVEELLAAAREAGDFLEAPLLDQMEQEDPDSMPALCGSYRPLKLLGKGGAGCVYLAVHRDDQSQAAIKVLRRRTGPNLRRRFLAEHQVLANLDHPNIARLFEDGTTPEGLPYFAMEYVDGTSIDAFCNHRRLDVVARLNLFLQVCSAVGHVHQQQVIHRDIKPSNILVTTSGVPKLLDFGIAKLLRPKPVEWPVSTTSDWYRPMTPQYASPEQIQGLLIGMRSDVYSLGILLYQLLSGHHPHRLEGSFPGTTKTGTARSQPLAPSRVVEAAAATGFDEFLGRVGLSPKELERHLRGDLDALVLTAMSQKPELRYPSVEQLADDIRRYLTGYPVQARNPTWHYRLGKFLRRAISSR